MRKISVIGASLLLLALASCSREKETTPADGFVKMSFKAVVDETRTAYENDKTVSWVAGDAISVYVTNGTDGQVVNFTAGEDLTFEGNVPAGYTTIVAGAYPADAAHTFDATGVKTLHLPASYTLAAGADPASVLPLAGTYANGVMTFRHPAGALKFTVDNVPATAVRFRFTAAGQKVNGSFAMDPALAATEVEAEQAVDITFPAAEGSRSFYVPMPAGELTAGAAIALYDAENNLLFQKTVPQALTVSKNVIKRIAAVETWKKNEDWMVTYLMDVYSSSSEKVGSYVKVTGTTGPYDIYLSTKSYFESHYGSIEGFLTSNYIPGKKASGTNPMTKNQTYNYNRLSPGAYVAILYGLDENYNFTGEYNIVECVVPEFTQPKDWHLTFKPQYRLTGGALRPAVHIQVPEGTSYSTANLKKETFLNNYGGDAIAYLWTRTASNITSTIRTDKDINLYFSSLDETDYVYIVYGVIEREQEGGNRTLTYDYALLEYTYTKPSDEPTAAYSAWIGKWSVTDNSATPKTETWTISAKKNNETYTISGVVGKTSSDFDIEGWIDDDGQLRVGAQQAYGKTNYKSSDGNTYETTLNFYGRKEASGNVFTGSYQLLKATLDASGDTATMAPSGSTYLFYSIYGTFVNAAGVKKSVNFGTRTANSAMTRVVEEGVMAPEGWAVEAEEFTQGPEPVMTKEALPAE